MKRQIFNIINSLVAILLCATMAHAQTKNSIHVQYTVAGDGLALNYERNLVKVKNFNLGASIGYQYANFYAKTYGSSGWSSFSEGSSTKNGYVNYNVNATPISVLASIGSKHKLEIIGGVSFNSIYFKKVKSVIGLVEEKNYTETQFFTSLGYRYQDKDGILFRCGVTNMYHQSNERFGYSLYLGTGYAF